MKHADIYKGLCQRLAALSGAPAIAWEGDHYEPTLGTAYVAPSLLPAQTAQAGIGSDAQERASGILQLMVMVQGGSGTGEAEIIAGALIDWFKRGTVIAVSDGHVRIDRAWPGPFIPQGEWLAHPVSIRYFAYLDN